MGLLVVFGLMVGGIKKILIIGIIGNYNVFIKWFMNYN